MTATTGQTMTEYWFAGRYPIGRWCNAAGDGQSPLFTVPATGAEENHARPDRDGNAVGEQQ